MLLVGNISFSWLSVSRQKASLFLYWKWLFVESNQRSIWYGCEFSDYKSQGSPTKGHITKNKEEKPVRPDEFLESSYFGSSVHYGARDFYPSSSSTRTSEIVCDTSSHITDGNFVLNIYEDLVCIVTWNTIFNVIMF